MKLERVGSNWYFVITTRRKGIVVQTVVVVLRSFAMSFVQIRLRIVIPMSSLGPCVLQIYLHSRPGRMKQYDQNLCLLPSHQYQFDFDLPTVLNGIVFQSGAQVRAGIIFN